MAALIERVSVWRCAERAKSAVGATCLYTESERDAGNPACKGNNA